MAEDKFDNENEENEEFDDDDFGLPDLEYDALDDDDEEEEIQVTSENDDDADDDNLFEIDDSEDEPEAPAEEESPIEEPVAEDDSDDSEDADDPFESDFGEEDIQLDEPDFDSIDADASADSDDFEGILEADESDLGDDFEAEFEVDDNGDADPNMGEEESTEGVFDTAEMSFESDEDYSDFDSEGDDGGDSFYDDNEFVPSSGDDNTGGFTKYIVIGVAVIVMLGIGFIGYKSFFGGDEEEKPVASKTKKKPVPKKKTPVKKETTPTTTPKEEPVKQQPVQADPDPIETVPVSTATQVPAGTISKMTGQNGKVYIVIASFIDEDLCNDYANQLSKEGKSPYIIPPFKDYKFYRLGIAEFETFTSASANIDSYRSEYGQDVWALKY